MSPQIVILAVVVTPELRGCGLGRQIMAAAEGHARELRVHCLHLFTNDKEQFYTHLGYKKGPVVSPLKKCTAKLDLQQASLSSHRYPGLLQLVQA